MKFLLGFLTLFTIESKADTAKAEPIFTETCLTSDQIRTEYHVDGGEYNVYNYGAKGDGSTLDTPSIQRAIDTCFKAGGGTVLLPYGEIPFRDTFLEGQCFS